MKRVMACLLVVVSCLAVSFVRAADVETVNVGFNFYVGAPCEFVSYPEDLHYAVVGVDGKRLLEGVLSAEDRGRFEGDIDVKINKFYVIVEQPSTSYFGSVLVRKDADVDELYFILDAFDLTWLEKAHRCFDDAECMKDDDGDRFCDHCAAYFFGEENDAKDGKKFEEGRCCDDDCCDEYCICRMLYKYLTDCAPIADGTQNVGANDKGNVADSGRSASMQRQNALQNGQSLSRGGQNGYSPRYSTNSSVLSNSPYSYGTSNFGTYGMGWGPNAGWGGAAFGASGGLSSLGMLGMIGGMIAVSVANNSQKPTSPANTASEGK